ncbi:CAP domain-containing protein [Ancylomarina euxinus]|uniref:CAP domain-containing protein n=1 Tax=Ancylomarina euxinus TaxID=2283627 RepID=A0A425Y4E2_9BACT|nr:CAP domain-containing protein [Ancylomarina euxinus]MCZ4694612.1 CAP domain-containing protein [Ancylomarina euxinus]MUP14155.1 CAP domain-containing protein [Ancylomarina euxinus]RRG23011.1 CAP domain-containing protein [Ancylomarina euxinus]
MSKFFTLLLLSVPILLISCGGTGYHEDMSIEESPEAKTLNEINRKDAFDYLNAVRNKPASFSDELGIDLSGVVTRNQLIWSAELAKAAYDKAKDMAERNYFAHVDPDGYGMNYKINAAGFDLADYLMPSKSANHFESIAAGTNRNTGEIMIQQLIIDKGIPSLGHRKHLLGMTCFWADAEYCGIGFYKKPGSTYTHYICVMIAKHK